MNTDDKKNLGNAEVPMTAEEKLKELEVDAKKEEITTSKQTRGITRIDSGMSWLGVVIGFIDKFGIRKILQGCLIIALFLVADFAYNAIHNDKMIEAIASKLESRGVKEEQDGMDIRKDIGPKLTNNLTKMMYSVGADRACIFEFHNGKENATSLPFMYFDMTYEEVNDELDIAYSSDNFTNLNTSFFKIQYYLAEHTFYIGTVSDMRSIDNRFANRVDEIGGKYVGMIMIKSNGVNIGILGVLFNTENPKVSRDYIHSKLDHYVQDVSSLLDLNVQKTSSHETKK